MANLISNDELTRLVNDTCRKCKKNVGNNMMGIVPKCAKDYKTANICQAEYVLLNLISLDKDCYFIFEPYETTLQLTEEEENNNDIWIIYSNSRSNICIGQVPKKSKAYKKYIKNSNNKRAISVQSCCRLLKDNNIYPLPDDKFYIYE